MPRFSLLPLTFFLLAAGTAAAQEPPSLKELADRYHAAASGSAAERGEALRAIGAVRTPSAAGVLSMALEHESDSTVRLAIVAALVDNGTPEALRVLLAVPEVARGDVPVRVAAAAALGASRAPEAIRRLLALYAEASAEPDVRLAVAGAVLGVPDGPWRREVDDFWFAALGDLSIPVRLEALRVLADRDDPRVVRAARWLLMAVHPEEVHRIALEPLVRSGSREAFLALLDAGVLQKDPGARELLLDALGGFSGAETLRHLLGPAGVAAKDASIRRVAVAVLARRKDGAGVEAVRAALGDRDAEVRLQALRGLVRAGAREAAGDALALADPEAAPEQALPALEAAVALGGADPELAGRVLAAVRALPVETRLDAAPTLARLPGGDALAPVTELLADEDWCVRAGAIAALRAVARKEGIPPLIARLALEDGRLRQDIADALARLTGRPFGFDAAVWEAWWREAEAGFVVPAEGVVAAPAADATRYYGIPVVSRRVCFLVDGSVSMAKPSLADEREGRTGPPRLAAAKRELADTVRRLAPEVRFNVAFFNDRVDPWRGKLARATEERKAEALGFVELYQPKGGTALYDAIVCAMDESDADTLFVLSDGKPGSGAFTEPASILREIARKNRRLRIVIHSICIGEPVEWLRNLAEQNGGTWVER